MFSSPNVPEKKPAHNEFAGRIKEEFYQSEMLNVPKVASSTIVVEGLPPDAIEREVAHIFRPFPGFKTVRIVHVTSEGEGEGKSGESNCFVDFESALQTTAVINTI